MLFKTQVQWTGNIIHMAQHSISGRLLYRNVLCDRKHQGQPKEWYSITIKTNFHWCKIRPKELEKCATDWFSWCAIVYQPLQPLNKGCHQKINIQKEPCHYETLVLVIITNIQCSYYSRLCVQTWFVGTPLDPLINYMTTILKILSDFVCLFFLLLFFSVILFLFLRLEQMDPTLLSVKPATSQLYNGNMTRLVLWQLYNYLG